MFLFGFSWFGLFWFIGDLVGFVICCCLILGGCFRGVCCFVVCFMFVLCTVFVCMFDLLWYDCNSI